jgi:DnaD/phage-associated family protein
MSEEQVISDPSDLKKYRTELPNLYDDADLDVYEHRLLCHYKRVGECTEGLETTARKCKMSEGKVSEVRQALADNGWITLQRVSMDKGRYRFIVRVVDRWIENFAKYSGFSAKEIASQLKKASPSPHEGIPSPREASPSPREGKKELIKNIDLVVNDADVANIAKLYEAEIGALTPLVADAIRDALQTYPADWITEAIPIAVKNNARRWNYVEAILKNCKTAGKKPSLNRLENKNGTSNTRTGNKPGSKTAGSAQADTAKPNYSDADRRAAARVKAKQQTPVP